MKFVSRLFAFVVLFALSVGGLGTANAHNYPEAEEHCADPTLAVAESQNNCEEDGFITLAGPQGQQIAVYCAAGAIDFIVRLGGDEGLYFSDTPGRIECDSAVLAEVLPGYHLVVNTSPQEGWVITAWTGQGEIRHCQRGTLTFVSFGMDMGDRPDVRQNVETMDCEVPVTSPAGA